MLELIYFLKEFWLELEIIPVVELYHPAILDGGQFLIQGDLGGSFAERHFKIGHRHCGTTTRAIKTAPFN